MSREDLLPTACHCGLKNAICCARITEPIANSGWRRTLRTSGEHSTLQPSPAGFRKGCSTTDQCLQLSQFISDGFQSTQHRHTIATSFDFSWTYDHVWCTGFPMKMSKMDFLRFLSLHRVGIILVHKAHSQSARERLHRPL